VSSADSRILSATGASGVEDACLLLPYPSRQWQLMQEHARDNIAPHKGPMWMQQAKRQQVEGKKLQGYFGTYENTLTFVTACGPKAIKYV